MLIRWVRSVLQDDPAGSDAAAGWMKTAIATLEVLTPALAIGIFYWALVRPWRRERRITTDGLLVVCFLTMWFVVVRSACPSQPRMTLTLTRPPAEAVREANPSCGYESSWVDGFERASAKSAALD